METAKKSRPKKQPASQGQEEKIKSAFVTHLLNEGRVPTSVFKFCQQLGVKEEDFYQYFGSFEAVERSIWKGFVERTIGRLQADDAFNRFTTRERVLAFYFTLTEEMKNNRSFAVHYLGRMPKPEFTPGYLKDFKKSFDLFFDTLLNEGKGSGEIAARPLLDRQYVRLFWLHLGFVLLFWKNDDSPGFEKTDAVIEKSVALAFDLIGKGAVDSAIDLAKFLFQNKN